ncbi:MAG: ROK family protein [Dysgonamonadaceae bacterium]|jgi:glucokinase|nr:ROK family protein [Dysgonamonadaceae bacterium]
MAVIGIDLGGTKINGAVFDNEGNLLHQTAHLLENRKGAEVGRLVIHTIRELLQTTAACNVQAIGICVPGISDTKTGRVWAPNIPGWESYPLQEEVENVLTDPSVWVEIAGDRSCYILGETWKGAAKGAQDALFIAVGTGIGIGILANGRILEGHAGISGAAGWLALDTLYEEDYVQYGCFESHASGNGIARCAQRLLKDDSLLDKSILREYPVEKITAHEVFDAWAKSDPLAVRVIERAIQLWGMAAANMVSLFNPEMIVWGGGVFGPAAQLLDRIYEEACRWAQPIAIKQVRFEVSQLSGDAGLYGAGRLALMSVE